MTNQNKIEYLKNFKKAINQAYAIMSIDEDCSFEKKEFKNIERKILNDDKIIVLTKQYTERNNNNTYKR